MIEYECQTCGIRARWSADRWAWHRSVEHPRAGLPHHRPRPPRRLVVSQARPARQERPRSRVELLGLSLSPLELIGLLAGALALVAVAYVASIAVLILGASS